MKVCNVQDNIEHMSSEEIYELLNTISDKDNITDKDIEILQTLSCDERDEIRTQVAEILGNSESPMAEKILIRFLQDKNGLVRACSCESLYYSNSLEVLNILMNMVKKDKIDLVRGYAATSIANILINTNKVDEEYINFFEELLNKEKVKWVKVNIYKTLYALGKSKYLYNLLDELNNKQFRKRGFVINLLLEVVTDENREIIKSSLEEFLKKEKTNLVKSIIERALKDICEDDMLNT